MTQERTTGAEFQGPMRNPYKADRMVFFLQTAETLVQGRNEAAEMVLAVIISLRIQKEFSHMRIQRLVYNEKGNQSGLQKPIKTSGMLLPVLRKYISRAAGHVHSVIIDVTRDQKCHQL